MQLMFLPENKLRFRWITREKTKQAPRCQASRIPGEVLSQQEDVTMVTWGKKIAVGDDIVK